MAEEPETDLCFSNEFESHAQSFVDKFLQSPPNIKDAVTILSIALAPHVRKSTTEKFLALFGALEEVVALEKLTQQENANLRRSDPDLIEALLEAKRMVEATENPNACAIAARLEGYANSVKNSGPSFNVRFNKFKEAHPSLPHYLSDLWPLQGSDNRPGLKQFRDALAHGLTKKYNHQAIAIAHWHFVRLAERLAFLVLGTDVPAGISHNSISLRRDPWYEQSTWRAAQEYARRPE